MGILCAFAGTLEKISSAPWFYATLVLFLFGVLYHNQHQSFLKRVFFVALILSGIILVCLALSALSLAYILSFAQKSELDALGIQFNASMVVFPLIFLYQNLTIGRFTLDSFVTQNPWLAVLVTWLAVFFATIVVYGVCRLVEQRARMASMAPFI